MKIRWKSNPMLVYRKELDGLRAIAVIAVIFYHLDIEVLGFNLLKGGFLGVDVFFVLSGYLITSVIIEKKVTLKEFYQSRFKRLYPALIFTLVLCCCMSYFLLTPISMFQFKDSLLGSLFFYSNYVFLFEHSYVSDQSKLKLLIHTWSLSLEWQFYFLYPIIIYFFKKRKIFIITLLLFSLSLFFYLYTQLFLMEKDISFFSLHTRAWELLAGSLVFFISKRNVEVENINWFFSLLIFLFFITPDNHDLTLFSVIITVFLTSVLILNVKNGSFLFGFLTNSKIVEVGLISYALYLTHQPILVFYRYVFDQEIKIVDVLFILPFIYVVSYLLNRYIENPFRRLEISNSIQISFFLFIFIVGYIFSLVLNNGFDNREAFKLLKDYQNVEYRRLSSSTVGLTIEKRPQEQCINRTVESSCNFGPPYKIITVGDSFAGVFDYSLYEALSGKNIRVLTYEQCPLLDKPYWFGSVPECWEINKSRWSFFKNTHPTTILVGTNFSQFYRGKSKEINPNFDDIYDSFTSSIKMLINLGHKPIILLQPPNPNIDVRSKMIGATYQLDSVLKKTYDAKSTSHIDNDIMRGLASIKGVEIINLNNIFCDGQSCLIINEKGGLFNQQDHLSYQGVQMVLPYIKMD